MKNNKQTMQRINSPSKKDDCMNEIYKRFESRSGSISKEARISPREFGKRLASDLIEKIDKEVVVKR